MKKIRNINPVGAVDVPLLGRALAAGEEFEVDDDVAAVLLAQDANYALADEGTPARSWTKTRLLEWAADHSVEVDADATKDDIYAALSARIPEENQ